MTVEIDAELMGRAIANAARVRLLTSPNPWVGAVLRAANGALFDGATRPPGGYHAEILALKEAGECAYGSTLYTTLEPCGHWGRTGPCVEALIDAGVSRVVIGILDPDPKVAGSGVQRLEEAGLAIELGVREAEIQSQLHPYLHHRATGRPLVVLKLASTLDGRIAASDGTSRWITGSEARAAVHRLRAYSDAICVGAGTIRLDDPSLRVRDWRPPDGMEFGQLDPMRIVLGSAAPGAKVHPCHEVSGKIEDVLDEIGRLGVLQLLVEGGAASAWEFHNAGLVDRYELFFAPALVGGDDGRPSFVGPGAGTIGEIWRGSIEHVEQLGPDLHVSLVPFQ